MERLIPWLTLRSVPGVGNLLFKRLMDRFQTPENVVGASDAALAEVEGISKRIVAAIRHHHRPDWIQQELDLVDQRGYRIVTLNDPDYPHLLLQIPDPPAYLYVKGRLDNQLAHVAVVGSRNATAYGVKSAQRLAGELSRLGVVVVSGMARGIDTAAHVGALKAGGHTVAILGSGLEHIYPAENLKLSQQIAENGAVVSEFELHAEPDAHHFPARNRIISGICLGTVVVEAAKRSGSLITARLAAEQNREVFAVPGSIQSFKSTGTHALIKQGAKLVETVTDIIEELPCLQLEPATPSGSSVESAQPVPRGLSHEEKRVYALLSPYPVHIDELARALVMPPGQLSGILLQLELKGLAIQTPGKYFGRSESEG
jgi:DNA processing protein